MLGKASEIKVEMVQGDYPFTNNFENWKGRHKTAIIQDIKFTATERSFYVLIIYKEESA